MEDTQDNPIDSTPPESTKPIVTTGQLIVSNTDEVSTPDEKHVDKLPERKPHAMPGNQNASKYGTPEKRKELCLKYCEHKRKGFSNESFVPCDMQTFNKYRTMYPSDFDTDMINEAIREGKLRWETMGTDGTEGLPKFIEVEEGKNKVKKMVYKRFNPQSYQFMMQNMFGWKIRTDVTTNDKELPTPIIGGQSTNAIPNDNSDK